MTAVNCDKFGFFNGLYGIEQSNWANYWKGVVPDGVISGMANEMEVYAQGDGMKVYVKTGQAMADNHRAWITAQKELAVSAADSSNDRLDLVVLRVVYGNRGESFVCVDVKAGTPSASPELPDLTQVTGETYEIPLAKIFVEHGSVSIPSGAVTDLRYVFRIPGDTADSFSGTSVTCKNDREYRNPEAIASLTVYLPPDPHETFMASICFSASASFTSVSFKAYASNTAITPKIKGDALTLPSRRYNMVIYWDGSYWWVASAAV